MDGFERESVGKEEKGDVVAAKAVFRELESKLEEIGTVGEPEMWLWGIPTSESRDAIRKLAAIRMIAAKNKSLVDKPNLSDSEAEELVGQSSTFSSSASYVNRLLGKKESSEHPVVTDQIEHADMWVSIVNVRNDISIVLDTLSKQNVPKYTKEVVEKFKQSAAALVEEAERSPEKREGILGTLQTMWKELREDSLDAMSKAA